MGPIPKWLVFVTENAIDEWMMTGGGPMTQETPDFVLGLRPPSSAFRSIMSAWYLGKHGETGLQFYYI